LPSLHRQSSSSGQSLAVVQVVVANPESFEPGSPAEAPPSELELLPPQAPNSRAQPIRMLEWVFKGGPPWSVEDNVFRSISREIPARTLRCATLSPQIGCAPAALELVPRVSPSRTIRYRCSILPGQRRAALTRQEGEGDLRAAEEEPPGERLGEAEPRLGARP